jgi:hypothetical protein
VFRLLPTRQALRDLGLDPDAHAGIDATALLDHLRDDLLSSAARQQVDADGDTLRGTVDKQLGSQFGPLVAFVTMRSQAPEGQEYTKHLPHSYKKVYNLHAGEDRAVTWWDRDHGIVWLLACGFHRSAQRDDFYPRVVALDADHELMPPTQDFLAAEPEPDEEFLGEFAHAARELVTQARAHPGTEHVRVVHDAARVGVYVELYVEADERAEELSVALRPVGNLPSVDLVAELLVEVLVGADLADIHYPHQLPHRSLAPGERVVRWTVA